MKLFKIVNANPVINKISAVPLPLNMGLRLLPALKQYSLLMKGYTDARDSLFDVYADLDDNTGKREIRESTKDEYEQKYIELMQTDVDWVPHPVGAPDFGPLMQLSLAELLQVDWFFKE